MDTFQQFWERVAIGALSLLLMVSAWVTSMFHRSNAKMSDKVDENKETLADHETRLQVAQADFARVKEDISEIKGSIKGVHSRLTANIQDRSNTTQALHDKLDILLEQEK